MHLLKAHAIYCITLFIIGVTTLHAMELITRLWVGPITNIRSFFKSNNIQLMYIISPIFV